ncbi:family 78 glycoside hydrolase catalytic domain [Halosimplex marinum]|uniref:family 78 glycoside hydrolase catalytic domain n=1 Tax=Halosimplex marinum TaxID=3396620 RepID=UPI003F5675E4
MTGERVTPTALRVEFRPSPSAVSADRPRFSWRVAEADWGDGQAAYRIRVASSAGGLDGDALWDSGRVDSDRSTAVPYDGPPLAADETYHWTVTVWNDAGDRSAPAEPAAFATAPDDWSGDWIAAQPGGGDSNGYRSCWRDPDDDPTEWVGVDLGGEREIDAVELYPAEPFTDTETPDGWTVTADDTEETYLDSTTARGPVAFGFPDRYRVEVADDPSFADARTVVDATDADRPGPRRDPVVHDIGGETAAHVRVVATAPEEIRPDDDGLRESFDAWAVFALAALSVRDGSGEDLARGRPVTASSSVETETWGADRLTDGRDESTMTGTSPLFRTEFDLEKPVASARARFVGLGYGELYLNGERASEDALNPGWTQYDERVLYSTYEVGDHLSEGANAVGIWLGRGWFARSARQWLSFGSPRARLDLTVEYEDGTTTTVSTGPDWRTAPSPVVENDIYEGETYDARLERPGWARAGFDDADWEAAAVADPPAGTLAPQRTDPIRVTETLEPVEIRDHEDGPVIDFGQNHTGWLSIDVTGGDPGDEVVLRHAEALDESGGLRTVDLRSADATDTYVVGEGDATYEPRFTYHGYRYAQVSGYPGELTADDVRSRVVHTDFDDAGAFACSNEDLTAVQSNARWGLRSNAHSVPTDCPQRDERMGFTGDGHIAARALQYNFDAARFHGKWTRDHRDAQSRHGYVPSKCPHGRLPADADPSWTVSLLAVPWHRYRFYGDESVLRRSYESFRRYVEYWESVAEDDLLPDDRAGFGDWVALENTDGRRGEPTDFFTNAYYYRSVYLLAKIAGALGVDEHAGHYAERAAAIADAFNDRYFDADAAAYEARTQAAYALPVFFGIAPDDRVDDVVANLVEKVHADGRKLKTGFLGTRPLLSVLSDHGHADVAYEVASDPAFPGWVYMLREGATTVWERWDSDSDEHIGGRMNSLNHSPFACVSEWFYEHLAGIDVRLGADADRVEVAPTFVDDLDWAEGSVETPLGPVESRWERTDAGHELAVEIPWNAEGRVSVPLGADASAVRVDGELLWRAGDEGSPAERDGTGRSGVEALGRTGDRLEVAAGSGSYRFTVE